MPAPAILTDAITQIIKGGKSRAAATAIATASLQKAGDLKPGSQQATAKGLRLGLLSQAQRKALRDKKQ